MKNWKNIFETKNITFIVFVVFALSLAWNTVSVIQRNYELQKEVDALENEVSILELENENMRLNIAYYETDTYLELAAREKFNKAAKGEKLLLLPKDGDGEEIEPNIIPDPVEERSQQQQNFDSWWEFLMGTNRET